MRTIARSEQGTGNAAGLPAPGPSGQPGWDTPSAEGTGFVKKHENTSLSLGGMTLDAEPGAAWLLHAGSPEPAVGFGAAKGLYAYYAAVRYFGTLPEDGE